MAVVVSDATVSYTFLNAFPFESSVAKATRVEFVAVRVPPVVLHCPFIVCDPNPKVPLLNITVTLPFDPTDENFRLICGESVPSISITKVPVTFV